MNGVIALDLEGTLICDQIDPRPRPGLYKFLDRCRVMGDVVMMTTVPESSFRAIADGLVKGGYAPSWFNDIDYIDYDKPYKDLRAIPNVNLGTCVLVDDYEGYVHPHQKTNWIRIDSYFDQGDNDRELTRVISSIEQIFGG